MSISSTPPSPPPAKKKGLGCLGCGCLIVALLAVLMIALVACASYFGYSRMVNLTSTEPASVPTAQLTDDIAQSTQLKVADFLHNLRDHQPTKMSLSADEINELISRSPDVIAKHVQIFVSLSDDRMRIQAVIPTNTLGFGMMKDRFVNLDVTLSPGFDLANKALYFHLDTAKIGDQVTPDNVLPVMQAELGPLINAAIRKNADGAALLDQTKNIQIRNGELNFETQ